jgi:hypothetical protein
MKHGVKRSEVAFVLLEIIIDTPSGLPASSQVVNSGQ